ncbi:MAG: glycosyltransferase [Opitutales bacterium]|nr:glycosyltransferase [Opitutales bacterium]
MRILLSIASWNPVSGGPFFSVGNLARHLQDAGNTVGLLAASYPHCPAHPAPEGVELFLISGYRDPLLRQTYLPGGRKKIRQILDDFKPDILHDNGLWLKLSHFLAIECERRKIARIVSPRGCLDPWALQYRNWKKKIALKLYQQKDLEFATAFHAASAVEAQNIRTFGLTQPIATIPNGVTLPTPNQEQRTTNQEQRTTNNKLKTALFLGRLHPIKNLPNLLRAWAQARPENWRLRIVGSDEVNHRAKLQALSVELGIAETVSLEEPLYGEAKEALFREANLFFLVSKSENFGISAAEAMAAGLPVIASRSTPWNCLEEHKLGWWAEGEPAPLASAITEATNLPLETLQTMGQRARNYAAKEFSWPAIATKMEAHYQWILNEGSQPTFVV